MATTYRVIAPYVTLMQNTALGPMLTGMYEGALVDGDAVPEWQLKHHLDGGMIEPVEAPPKPVATAAPTTEPASDSEPAKGDELKQPALAAPKADWVDFAVSRGAARDAAEAMTQKMLIDRYGQR